MDIRDILKSFDQLTEGDSTVHKAGPGGYGNKHGSEDVTDQYGKPIGRMSLGKLGAQKDAEGKPKPGKGRPVDPDKPKTGKDDPKNKKVGDIFGRTTGSVPKGKKGTEHGLTADEKEEKKAGKKGLKEYFDQMDQSLVEADAYTTAPMPGAVAVKDASGKVVATAKNPQAAAAFEKGDITLGGDQGMAEGDVGKHNNATTGFDALVRKLTPKYGVEAAKRIAGSKLKKMSEAEMPTHDGDMGAGLGAGRSQQFEAKKPDADKDGVPDWADKKPGKDDNEGKKKGAAPKKGVNPFAKKDEKQKVKEGMDHKLQSARLRGKSHALAQEAYNCHYDDMEEARCYHEGFKEGLDECYGQMPILGLTAIGEMGQGPEVDTMASYGADKLGEMDKTSYMKQQAIKTPGDTFNAFGQTMRDSNVLDEFAFEALDKQLNAILEGKEVSEGMTVSISKGQQGSPDSVSVSAQDGEADQLLSIIKSAGMGLFGGDEQNGYGAPQGSTQAPGGISVVDDHDGMMALMKKLSGNGGEMSDGDYESEEGSDEGHMHGEEETCDTCGSSPCDCDSEEMVDETQSEDQMAYEVAEADAPDSGADNTDADVAGNAATNSALATVDAAQNMATAQTYSNNEDNNEELDEFFDNQVTVKGGSASGGSSGVSGVSSTGGASSATGGTSSATGGTSGSSADATNTNSNSAKISENDKEDHKCEHCDCNPCECDDKEKVDEGTRFANLFRKIAMLSEESTSEKDAKAEKAGKKVAKDIEYDEGHKGKDDDKAEKAGKKVTKDIEYDDKKDKVDESYANSADDTFEADIGFMMNVISGGLNKQKSTGQTTIPVIAGQKNRMGADGLGNPMKESTDLLKDYMKLSGL